jgi:hypothetical protein
MTAGKNWQHVAAGDGDLRFGVPLLLMMVATQRQDRHMVRVAEEECAEGATALSALRSVRSFSR